MSKSAHRLVLPSKDCRRLGHRIETRNKQGPGVYEYCLVCSLGYEMSMSVLHDEKQADEFVKSLRSESIPSGG